MPICECTTPDTRSCSIQPFLEAGQAEQDRILAGSNVHERVRIQTKTGTVNAGRGDVARVLEAAAGLH
jgi:DNA damage-binding protein 1